MEMADVDAERVLIVRIGSGTLADNWPFTGINISRTAYSDELGEMAVVSRLIAGIADADDCSRSKTFAQGTNASGLGHHGKSENARFPKSRTKTQ